MTINKEQCPIRSVASFNCYALIYLGLLVSTHLLLSAYKRFACCLSLSLYVCL